MKSGKPCSSPQFAVCVNNVEYPASLELHKVYRVVPDDQATQAGDIRVIDESGEDYLYPAAFFVLVDVPQASARKLTRSLYRSNS